jgi:hypothetical protein
MSSLCKSYDHCCSAEVATLDIHELGCVPSDSSFDTIPLVPCPENSNFKSFSYLLKYFLHNSKNYQSRGNIYIYCNYEFAAIS